MLIPDIYFHTNVPAPYRKHHFDLIAREFPHSVIYLIDRQASYRPWSDAIEGWVQNVKHVTRRQVFSDLLRQKWGSVHVCGSGVGKWYRLLLAFSGLIGHSRIIIWDDGCTKKQIELVKFSCGGKLSFKRWLLRVIWTWGRIGAYTAGKNGADMAKAKGLKESQIINNFLSHDVDYFVSYDKLHHKDDRLRIRAQHQIGEDKIVILNISRYLELKRLVDLAEALLVVEHNSPMVAKNIELIIIGDGAWKAHLPVLERLKIIKVHLVKQMPPDEVLPYYCASDIFVFPSEGDVWGLVVNEALSMGLPVICTNEIGAAELVNDGVNGYVVPARNPNAIAESILRLEDRELRNLFSCEARKIGGLWRMEMGVVKLKHFIEENYGRD